MAMPKTTNTYAARTFRAIAKPYDTLADAFTEDNGEKLYAEVQAAQQMWHKVRIANSTRGYIFGADLCRIATWAWCFKF